MGRSPQPRVYRARRVGEKLRRRASLVGGLVTTLVLAWVALALFRSPPPPRLSLTIPTRSTISGAALVLHPPLGAQEAVAIDGIGTIAIAGEQSPNPIASLTKVMSALVVLHDHPLSLGESGPRIAVTAADVATYRLERSESDSVVAVRVGERLSELQALEAALIPSGDNIVQLLADWDAGSSDAFAAKMNDLARRLGLHNTHYAGPSGVNPATVSTAADQLRLAEVAMGNPVFAGIVGMPQVSLPVAGLQYNVDADLGSDGINGIKTGWVPQGGGCFLFSAEVQVKGQRVSLVGAVLGEQGATPVPSALDVARELVVSTEKTIRVAQIAARSTVATLADPGGRPVSVITSAGLSLLAWNGARVQVDVRPRPVPSAVPAGSRVGTIVMTLGAERRTAALIATAALKPPSLAWRLTHL